MGKRIDALRVAFARPKRTNWKAAYSTADVANRKQLELINLLRKQEQQQVVRADIAEQTVTRLIADADSLAKRASLIEKAIKAEGQPRSHEEKMREPFNFKQGDATRPHSFTSGYLGNAWKCQTCGKGTRDLRHKGRTPIPVPTQEASDEALAVVEQLPGRDVSSRTPEERSTDGYYVSGRSLNYKSTNPSKRRAYVHQFTCTKISNRREDDTVMVVGDADYVASKRTIGRWLWGADMKQVRAIAKSHRKYTKLCECIGGVVSDDADNHNGEIGSMITAEQEEG